MKRTWLTGCFALLAMLPRASAAQPALAPAAVDADAGLTAGLEALRTSDYAAAETALGNVHGAARGRAQLALARVMFEEGRWADAERAAIEAAASADLLLASIALRAQILAARGRVDDAIKLLSPHKDGAGVGGRRVRLELGELLIRRGHRADAEPILLKFADEYDSDAIASNDAEGLALVGRAMALLRHPKDANRAFDESERAERGRVETLLFRADLYADKYDPGHAEEVLTEALKIAPRRSDAMVALARVKLSESFDFDAAESLVRDALATNPNDAGAFAVRAGIALHDGNLTAANAAIDAGLGVDPNDLDLLSLRAAARFLADDKVGFETAKHAIFAQNAEFSKAYGIIGEYAEWEHRYDDVVSLMKEAVALDPKDSQAWAQLGLMQTRAGDEAAGLQALEEAWRGDHFNVRVYNTLELLYRQWIPSEYVTAPAGIFTLRYPKDERAVLERYVPRMLSQAWGEMKVHYMFAPSTPVAVEMYRDREHFSVRTSGLPNIGIQGVCFGRVVAAMSPNSEPFNWGNVLWHELAHVFAIQLSANHVPRWFTEGLSEYETMVRRPEWQRELDPELYLALKKNRLPGALDMNAAFTHAEGDLDVTVAYYAASQMLAFTAEEFGFPRITRALELWGTGATTADVLRGAFGVSAPEYDARFHAWAMARLHRYDGQYMFDTRPGGLEEVHAAVVANPQSATAHVAYALALLRAHQPDEAKREVDEALKIGPADRDAHFLAAKLAAGAHDVDGQEKHLRAIQAGGGDGYIVEMALAEVATARHDQAAARAALESAHRFDPTQVEPLRALFDLDTNEKRDTEALDALRQVTLLDQHDRHAWGLLLGSLVARKRWDEARKVGEAALYVDVENWSVHSNYARALAEGGDHAAAAYELESATLCDAKPTDKASLHARLAREQIALGDLTGARSHRDEALRLDPNNVEARALSF
ncbi:MAG: tetratricopeptide repeat protein [Polyangiaceae bacterium]|jgi:tetratricopeptide (TPR) repeat protein